MVVLFSGAAGAVARPGSSKCQHNESCVKKSGEDTEDGVRAEGGVNLLCDNQSV